MARIGVRKVDRGYDAGGEEWTLFVVYSNGEQGDLRGGAFEKKREARAIEAALNALLGGP